MDLHLPLKGVYFDQIASGEKVLEYRLVNDYWRKRLVDRKYENVILTKGYPKKGDHSRRMVCRYRGYSEVTIQHEHFGDEPVKVFAIKVSSPQPTDHEETNV